MGKKKFKFNTETLCYEEDRFSIRHALSYVVKKSSIISIMALGILYVAVNYFDTPKIKILRAQQEDLLVKYQMLGKELSITEEYISDMQFNDDQVFRVYFDKEPLAETFRNAGSGGIDRYSNLNLGSYSDLIINASKRVDNLSRKLVTQSKSYDELIKLVQNKEKLLAARPSIQPISIKDLTRFGSAFGMRMHPILHYIKMHQGIDLTAPTGTKVYASADGTVTEAEYTMGGYGRKIKINHGFGYETIYGHLSKILVESGQKVKRGDVIGLVGNTGLSTCSHLHYEIHVEGRPVNPINYYTNDLSAEEYDKMIKLFSSFDPSFDIN
jgi:murein DD-endopeptidase MepM/ murein hydrolase activator NlpD